MAQENAEPKQATVVSSQNASTDAKSNSVNLHPAPIWSVESALKEFNLPTHTTPPTSPLAFFHLIERLKTTAREGWIRFEIKGDQRVESIADHMYRMSIITLTAPASLSSRLDIARCTRMALVHDMAESLVGDITPMDNVPKAEKSRRELATIVYIADTLLGAVPNGGKEAGQRIKADWTEYEDGLTEESKFVHDVDKLELLLQMVEYEKEELSTARRLDLGEFTGVSNRIELPEMKAWAAEVLQERVDFWSAVGGEEPKLLADNKAYIAANLPANGAA